MPAKLTNLVGASKPEFLPLPLTPPVPAAPSAAKHANGASDAGTREAFAREARRRAREESLARWRAIEEAGGRDAWIRTQLAARNLLQDHVDPAKLSDKEKQHYKETKRAEAEARRELETLSWTAWKATHIGHLGSAVHWEESTDPDRFDVPDLDEKARALGLPELRTAADVAAALGLSISHLRWLTYHREVDTGTHYRRWRIPKRNGTSRVITAPKETLKAAQRWALRNVFEKLPVHGAAHGFLPGRSIATNAAAHAGADVIVKLDIRDFFPTVNWRRVKGLLRKSGLREGPATLLALLVTEPPRELVSFRGKTLHVATGPRALPQGAPTSPAISNAVCLHLDRRLSGLAAKLGFRYTRYADDLAFSWRLPPRSPDAKARRPEPAIGTLLKAARAILAAEGFRLHEEKTRVLRGGTSQRLTGLVLNRLASGESRVRTPRETVRRLRAAIHNLEHGRPLHDGETIAHLRGMAAFVHMTDPWRGAAFLARLAALEKKRLPASG